MLCVRIAEANRSCYLSLDPLVAGCQDERLITRVLNAVGLGCGAAFWGL
ncbi:hypothetical protein MLPF_2264 [Mycobacterium lepromatosis]|nr:hypothetical protein MLPF_2264 [Mycobacterium lepromatosis]